MTDYTAAMLDLADECETRTNPDDVLDRFLTAYDLMWAVRGGETQDAVASPVSFRERFMRMLGAEAYESAAIMLMPVTGRTGPGHYGGTGGAYHPFSMGIGSPVDGRQIPSCTIASPGRDAITCIAPLPGLAMLAAILRTECARGSQRQRDTAEAA